MKAAVEEVSSLQQGVLTLFTRNRAVPATQVGGAGANVYDQGVVEHLEAVGDEKKLGGDGCSGPRGR